MGRYESPEYDVVLKEGNYELRSYKNFYVVEYENPEDPDLNYGFGTLFKYISYSGSWSTSREEKQSKLLEAWILENNLTAQSSYRVAVYNGPFVPPIFRHNEVMVRVSQEV